MILDTILSTTRAALAERRARCPEGMLRDRFVDAPQPLDLASCLRERGVSIIAEMKRASPSRGPLNLDLRPARLAATYASAGAQAISVLTEEHYFHGSLSDLDQARRGLATAQMVRPLLRKDFVVDSYQLLEARAFGADAVLLIVAALDDVALARLLDDARCLGLTPLVEVHDERELGRALALDPPVVGINNRDLTDFHVDLDVTRRLRPLIPPGIVVVSESGIHQPDHMRRLRSLRVDAALIGHCLVTASDPASKLRQLQEAGQ